MNNCKSEAIKFQLSGDSNKGNYENIKIADTIFFKKDDEIKSGAVVWKYENLNKFVVVFESDDDIIHKFHYCFVSFDDIISKKGKIRNDMANYMANSILYGNKFIKYDGPSPAYYLDIIEQKINNKKEKE